MLFYLRESSRSDQLARNEFEDYDVLHYYYDDKIASVGGNAYDDYYQLVLADQIQVEVTCGAHRKYYQSKLDQVWISSTFDMHHMFPPLEPNPPSFDTLLWT